MGNSAHEETRLMRGLLRVIVRIELYEPTRRVGEESEGKSAKADSCEREIQSEDSARRYLDTL